MGRVVYIVCHCNLVKRASSVLSSPLQSSGQRWCLCSVCTLYSPSLLLPLAIVCGRQLADVLTKPLSRLRLTELKKMISMEGVLGLAAGLGEELLSNLLLPCMNVRQGQTPKGSLLLHCSRCRGRRRTALLPHYSHSRGRRQSQPCCHI